MADADLTHGWCTNERARRASEPSARCLVRCGAANRSLVPVRSEPWPTPTSPMDGAPMSGPGERATPAPLIAVLDYGIGNLRSAQKALQRLGADARLTADHDLARRADGVVLPGVGAFGRCMEAIRDVGTARRGRRLDRRRRAVSRHLHRDADALRGVGGGPGRGRARGARRRRAATARQGQGPADAVERAGADPGLRPLGRVARPGVGLLHPLVRGDRARPGQGRRGLRLRRRGHRRGRVGFRQWAVQFHPEKSGAAGLHVLSTFVAACAGRE